MFEALASAQQGFVGASEAETLNKMME